MLKATKSFCFKGFDGLKAFSSFFGKTPGCGSSGCSSNSTGGGPLSKGGFSFGFFPNGSPSIFSTGFSSGSHDSGPFGTGKGSGGEGGGGAFGGPFGGLFDKALEWCSEAHARSIAQRQGIDIREIRFEKTPEGGMKVSVDAPNATPKQIEQLGEQVMVECPVARFRKTQVSSPNQSVEWRRLPDPYDR